MLASASTADLTSQLLTGAGSSTNLYQQQLAGSTNNLMGLPGLLPGASSTSSLAAGTSDARLLSEALLMRRPAASTGDLASLQGAALMGGGGELRGIASTGNVWGGAAAQQDLAGLGGAPWSGSVPDLQLAAQQAGLAPWQLQEAAAQLRNQQALLGLQQSASMDNLLAMNNPAHAALLLQAMNNINAQHVLVRISCRLPLWAFSLPPLSTCAFAPSQAQSLRAGKQPLRHKDRRDEGALGGPGGRLSRRNLDPVAEAERKAQQEKLYALDLDKIMAGARCVAVCVYRRP